MGDYNFGGGGVWLMFFAVIGIVGWVIIESIVWLFSHITIGIA